MGWISDLEMRIFWEKKEEEETSFCFCRRAFMHSHSPSQRNKIAKEGAESLDKEFFVHTCTVAHT